MPVLLQFAIGLIFGLGLLLSGMSNPAKVLNFLDLGGIGAGTWDPSLAFVMAGAVAVTFAGFNFVLKRSQPLFAETFHLPTKSEIDRRIILGPAIFGVGWGRRPPCCLSPRCWPAWCWRAGSRAVPRCPASSGRPIVLRRDLLLQKYR